MTRPSPLSALAAEVTACRACPRLVAWREEVARVKRRSYASETYWGRPVPAFGDPRARIVLLGLAPGAHGANRTGRMFTGDASGDFLYPALHRAGLVTAPTSRSRDDGLEARGLWITAAARCAPPENAPAKDELGRCHGFLARELDLLGEARVVLALGAIACEAYLTYALARGATLPKPRPKFRHGLEIRRGEHGIPHALIASYHVSRQNTNTGRLTPAMLDAVIARALDLADRR